MKRFITGVFLALFMLISLDAQSLAISLRGKKLGDSARHSGSSIDIDGQKINLKGISLFSLKANLRSHDFLQLPFDQRSELYEHVHLSIVGPVCMNLLLGFGKGSNMQNHIGGTIFGYVADLVAFNAFGLGGAFYLLDMLLFGSNTDLSKLGVEIIKVGGVFFLTERLVQTVVPISYGLRFNKTLRAGLGIHKDGSDMISIGVNLAPPASMNLAQGLGIQIVGKISISL